MYFCVDEAEARELKKSAKRSFLQPVPNAEQVCASLNTHEGSQIDRVREAVLTSERSRDHTGIKIHLKIIGIDCNAVELIKCDRIRSHGKWRGLPMYTGKHSCLWSVNNYGAKNCSTSGKLSLQESLRKAKLPENVFQTLHYKSPTMNTHTKISKAVPVAARTSADKHIQV
ncbi:hypothetical protein BDR06DRAFT_967501 [Suillus hirtellus]|nr:hypothetical protein BDR06DRAFT_967501 [Suillus hirtellus]